MQAALVLLLACVVCGISGQLLPPRPVVGRNCRQHLNEVNQQGLLGAWRPSCEADGSYSALQHHGSTGMSFCVDTLGQTIVAPQRGLRACACPRERATVQQSGAIGAFLKACDNDGTYSALQFHGSSGFAYCFTPEGETIISGRGVRACKCPRARFEASRGAPMAGRYIPQCNDNDGSFLPKQGSGSTGYSWCVNQEGVQVGEAVRPGTPLSC